RGDELRHVFRQRRLERQRASDHRMIHRYTSRMQRLARKIDRAQLGRPEDVPLLTHECMTAQPRLNAYLVALAGYQPDFNQGRLGEALDKPVLTDRFLTSRVASMCSLLN